MRKGRDHYVFWASFPLYFRCKVYGYSFKPRIALTPQSSSYFEVQRKTCNNLCILLQPTQSRPGCQGLVFWKRMSLAVGYFAFVVSSFSRVCFLVTVIHYHQLFCGARPHTHVHSQSSGAVWKSRWTLMSWCLMSSDVIWHIRDKLWPMPKHGSIKSTYVRCMRV